VVPAGLFRKSCTTFTDDAGQCFIVHKRLIDWQTIKLYIGYAHAPPVSRFEKLTKMQNMWANEDSNLYLPSSRQETQNSHWNEFAR